MTRTARHGLAPTALLLAALLAGAASASTHTQRIGSGHGFFVDEGGHILTSRHIVQDCPAIQVLSPTLAPLPATLVALPGRRAVDLALLRTRPVKAEVLAFRDTWPDPAPPAGRVLQIDQPIDGRVIAYERDGARPLSAPVRIVANRHRAPDIKILVLQGVVVAGQSGSPVTDSDGRIIGITFARLEADNPLHAILHDQPGGYAMATREATDFLTSNGIQPRTLPHEAEVSDTTHGAVIRVICNRPRQPERRNRPQP